MASGVRWTGLQEFKQELLRLPDELKDDAAQIVVDTAQRAGRDVQAAYPQGATGNLKKGVRTTIESQSGLGARALVRSTAPHAHLFERGTRLRSTHSGANRGRMPEANESQQMIPIAIRARRQMVADLIQMVERHGLKVTAS
jgi:hypothetical protein